MMLIEVLRENDLTLNSKGTSAMAKAIKDVFPTVDDALADDKLVGRVLLWDLKEEDCLKILELTGKYAKLWLFS